MLTTYDERGGYGHPDHIQVHHVGVRAAELAHTPRVYAATVSRQHFVRARARPVPGDARWRRLRRPRRVRPRRRRARITTTVDVSGVLDRKRAAMAAHASQIGEESFFLALPDDAFLKTFGTEWFIRLDRTPDTTREPGSSEPIRRGV